MNSEAMLRIDQNALVVQLAQSHVSVSYLSSLLRVIQVGLREVARNNTSTRIQFDRQPQPMLLISINTGKDSLKLSFNFSDSSEELQVTEFSSQIFSDFLEYFAEFVRSLPQPSLWGGAALRSPNAQFESEVIRRMDQIYRALRRSTKATMSFQKRTIKVNRSTKHKP